MKLDEAAIQELRDVQSRIGQVWPTGTTEVLEARNPELLAELNRLQTIMDSLLTIPNWPAPIRKQWRTTLADYEKTATQCVTYAKRHLVKTQGN